MSEGVTRNKKNKKETNITAISPDRPPEGRGTGHQKRWKDNIENRQQPVVESKRRRRRRRRRKRWPNIYWVVSTSALYFCCFIFDSQTGGCYADVGFSWVSLTPPGKFWNNLSKWIMTASSISFPVHHPKHILIIYCTSYTVEKGLLNKVRSEQEEERSSQPSRLSCHNHTISITLSCVTGRIKYIITEEDLCL